MLDEWYDYTSNYTQVLDELDNYTQTYASILGVRDDYTQNYTHNEHRCRWVRWLYRML